MKVESADIEEQTVKDVDNEDEVVKEAKEVIASSRPNTTPPVYERSMLDRPMAVEVKTRLRRNVSLCVIVMTANSKYS